MEIVTIKTGAEKYANRLFTTEFYLMPKLQDERTLLTDHPTYMPHEQIMCGLNGCFGQWEIGHVSLSDGSIIIGVLTRKILAYDPHNETNLKHYMIYLRAKIPGKRNRRYTRNYWGYNGGIQMSVMLEGRFDILEENKEEWELTTPLDKLPF